MDIEFYFTSITTLHHCHYDSLQFVTIRYDLLRLVTRQSVPIRYNPFQSVSIRYYKTIVLSFIHLQAMTNNHYLYQNPADASFVFIR